MSEGSRVSAVLMVAGLCVGGAMIGLPSALCTLGFYGAMMTLVFCWCAMTYTALLTFEANSAYPVGCHFLTMAGRSLGAFGKLITSLCYLLLLYALLSAYLTAGADMLTTLIGGKVWHAAAFILLFMTTLIAIGTDFLAGANRLFMFLLLLAYGVMVVKVLPHAHLPSASLPVWHDLPIATVVALTSFGFHILIPTLRAYLQDNRHHMIAAVVYGSLVALVIYVIWVVVVMASVPRQLLAGIQHGHLSSSAMLAPMFAHIDNALLVWAGHCFVLMAVLTSFIGVLISLVDFLSDSLVIAKTPVGLCQLLLFSLAPPLFFTLVYPHGFVLALSYAGIMVAILHGILPAMMVWQLRCKGDFRGYQAPGGFWLLGLIILASFGVIGFEMVS